MINSTDMSSQLKGTLNIPPGTILSTDIDVSRGDINEYSSIDWNTQLELEERNRESQPTFKRLSLVQMPPPAPPGPPGPQEKSVKPAKPAKPAQKPQDTKKNQNQDPKKKQTNQPQKKDQKKTTSKRNTSQLSPETQQQGTPKQKKTKSATSPYLEGEDEDDDFVKCHNEWEEALTRSQKRRQRRKNAELRALEEAFKNQNSPDSPDF